MASPTLSTTLTIAPAQVVRGAGILASQGTAIARLGQRPLVTGGDRSLAIAAPSSRQCSGGAGGPTGALRPRL
jgi:hypothetical protein